MADYAGYLTHSFSDDYYHRFHVDIDAIDVGYISAPVDTVVTVLNAHLVAQTLTSISGLVDGIAVITPDDLPLTIQPLQTVQFIVRCEPTTGGVFSTVLLLHFGGATISVSLTGQAPYAPAAWPVLPDWSNGNVETLAWLTDIMRSQRGYEQRRCLRDVPRWELSYSYLVQGRTRQLIDNLLSQWFETNYLVPLVTDVQMIGTALAVDDVDVSCATEYYDFKAGGYVLLYFSETEYAVMPIASIGVGTITLDTPVTRAWPRSTRIYPLRMARFQVPPAVVRLTDDISRIDITWLVMDRNDSVEYSAVDVFNDIAVYTLTPNEVHDRTHVLQRLWLELDNTTALPVRTDIGYRGFVTVQHRLLIENLQQRSQLKALLYALCGMQGAVWVPTGARDFTLAADAVSGAALLQVENCGFRDYGTNRRYLAIRKNSSNWHFCEVAAAGEISDDVEAVAISPALPWALKKDQGRISFMFLMRLASDVVALNHVTDTISETDLMFTEVLDNVVG